MSFSLPRRGHLAIVGLAVIAALGLSGCVATTSGNDDGAPSSVGDSWTAKTTGSASGAGSCHLSGSTHNLPDATCTPGAVTSQISPADTGVVCGMVQLSDTAPSSGSVADSVFSAYGIASSKHGNYRLQYLVPRALGGANDVTNLWPAPIGGSFADSKTEIDRVVTDAVCAQRVGIQAAQFALAHSWPTALADLRLAPSSTASP